MKTDDKNISLAEYDPYKKRVDDQGHEEWLFRCHDGQWAALQAQERFILILAGRQSGKTIFAPWWLLREIMLRGPGDYLFVTPTYKLLKLKALPEFLRLFEKRLGYGTFLKSDMQFVFNERGLRECFGPDMEEDGHVTIYFGHAANPESLESATAKAAVLDECGQKTFRLESWEAINGRLTIHEGRILMCTTPYYLGWLKKLIFDKRKEPDKFVVQFKSTMNPAFPQKEYDRIMSSGMPEWRRKMFYDGEFTHPAGQIYDCFEEDEHTMDRIPIPDHWKRYVGMDFGAANHAGVYLAAEEKPNGEPTGRYYVYRTYHAGNKTYQQHKNDMLTAPQTMERMYECNGIGRDQGLRDEPRVPTSWGGAASESQERLEFGKLGWRILKLRMGNVEVQIQRTYELISTGRLLIFNDLTHIIDDLHSYSRKLDLNSNPTDVIEDKASYHLLDALRYVCTGVNRPMVEREVRVIKANL